MKILGAHWFQRKDEASFQGNQGLQRNPWSWPRDWSTAERWDRMDRPPVAQNYRRHNTSQTNWTPPPPRKIMSQHCFCGGQNEGRGDLDSGRDDLCVPSSAVCETYSFNATHQLIILRSFFLFLNKRTATLWVQRFSVLFVSSVSEVRSFLTTILN